MKSYSLLSLVAVGVAQVDEQTNLLQTKTMQTLQQRSAEAEDCYASGGCVTAAPTTTTAAPTTTTAAPTTTTAAPTTTTAAPTTTTTTAAPTTTTTTVRRTRPTRPPTTTAAPTTTTTMTTPTFGEVVVDIPQKPPGAEDPEIDPTKFCSDEAVEFYAPNLGTPQVNNLGGMGPGSGRSGGGFAGTGNWAGDEVIAYSCGIKTGAGECVDIVISTPDDEEGEAYNKNHATHNRARSAAESKFGRKSSAFIGAYNGNSKPGVVAIGALVPGAYKFKFSFYDQNKNPVEIAYLPMTFYDLDGKHDLPRDARYEVAMTDDAEGVVSFKHATLQDKDKLKHGCDGPTCMVESVAQEVEIPNSFDTLTDAEKSAAATFLFAHKSSITLTYKLNYGHRVFLFKGSKSLYCDEFREQEEEEEETTTTSKRRFRFR